MRVYLLSLRSFVSWLLLLRPNPRSHLTVRSQFNGRCQLVAPRESRVSVSKGVSMNKKVSVNKYVGLSSFPVSRDRQSSGCVCHAVVGDIANERAGFGDAR